MVRPVVCDRCAELIGYYEGDPATQVYCRTCGERKKRQEYVEQCTERIERLIHEGGLDISRSNEISRMLTALQTSIKS